jgi:small subunit ribosomal protein S15
MKEKKINRSATRQALTSESLLEIREKIKRHESDVGSPEFQIVSKTRAIMMLNNHLQQAKKDYPVARRIVQLVSERKKLLDYLKRKNQERYIEVIDVLGLRR